MRNHILKTCNQLAREREKHSLLFILLPLINANAVIVIYCTLFYHQKLFVIIYHNTYLDI